MGDVNTIENTTFLNFDENNYFNFKQEEIEKLI